MENYGNDLENTNPLSEFIGNVALWDGQKHQKVILSGYETGYDSKKDLFK